ncbi:hypothetical protein DMR83_09620 [Klebsiella variicola]|nr:hypothetical protein DMR83_09620 [Klebsiella variicola]
MLSSFMTNMKDHYCAKVALSLRDNKPPSLRSRTSCFGWHIFMTSSRVLTMKTQKIQLFFNSFMLAPCKEIHL